MALVPGGTFTMGADTGGEEDEHPAHQVTLTDAYLDLTEVTNEAYDACVAAKACHDRPRFPQYSRPKQPVNFVRWDDAAAYCAWKGKRLPREAEFERAERGDDGRRFPWGNDPPAPDKVVFLSYKAPLDVGSKPLGRGPYGHDDLAGNVWEWLDDLYDPYAYRRPTAAEGKPGSCDEILAAQDELRREHKQGFTGTNPIPTECEHVIRGGAFNYAANGLRATNRVHHGHAYQLAVLGFRCAKDAP